ncbi:MAG: Flp pilus assembly protein CpaB [Elusimicrobiaceae bacterium]|nr:Flp pilus assembly protein CpaB [Elusimicrobiaceae bacterium]
MKRGVLLPLAMAVLAAFVYMMIVRNTEKKAAASQKMVSVLVPMKDIKEREVIKGNYLQSKPIPAAWVQKDALTYSSDADLKALENTVARIQIPKGNQISKYAITSLSPEAGLSSKIPVSMRGVILSDVPIQTASMIKPDDNVDILLTFEAVLKSGQRQNITLTLLQNIKVLAVGSDLGQGVDAKTAAAMKSKDEETSAYSDNSSIALALSPKDAQYLALAKEQGKVSVVLRSHGDMSLYTIEIASFERLFQ